MEITSASFENTSYPKVEEIECTKELQQSRVRELQRLVKDLHRFIITL